MGIKVAAFTVEHMNPGPTLAEAGQRFESACIALATGKGSFELFEAERAVAMSRPELLSVLPRWAIECRYGSQFWDLMKKTSATWAGRREFIYAGFKPLHEWIEAGLTPVHASLDSALKVVTSETISTTWQKILSRKATDPEGVITAARSMVESTCKHILGELNIAYAEDGDLPKLYKATARNLKLGVEQHDDQVLKQILSACGSAVDGLAGMRNKLGDAHGSGKRHYKPSSRHADLAANLAGTLCSFMLATFESQSKNASRPETLNVQDKKSPK